MRSLACWSVAVSVLLVAGSARGQEPAPNIDLTYVSDEAVLAAVVHPRAALRMPGMEMLPLEVFTALGKQELGIDPLQVEQVIALSTAPPADGGLPDVGVIVRFSKPYQLEQMLPQLLAATEEAELDGKPYRRAAVPFGPNLMMPDDRTLLVTVGNMLPKMLKEQQADTTLRRVLGRAKIDHHALAFLSVEAVREQVKQQLGALPPLPGPLAEFLTVPDHLDYIAVRLSVERTVRAEIVLQAPSEQSAAALERLANMALALGRQAVLAETSRQVQDPDDPIAQAGQQYAERITGAIFDSLQPQRNDKRLTLAVQSDAGIASTGIAVGMLLPAVQAAREAARRNASVNNLKIIAIAMHNHHDAKGKFPPRASVDKDGKPLLSWRVHILPFIEEDVLYRKFKLDEPWDSEHNKQLIPLMPAIYSSPRSAAEPGKSSYVVPTGKGTIFAGYDSLPMRQITDGTARTIMALEVDDAHAPIWTKPDDWEFDPKKPTAGLMIRSEVFSAMFADASVQSIHKEIDPEMFQAMLTAAGGEAVELDP